MKLSTEDCQAYLHVLKEELIPAMGCTEPIAIAFAAARALELLGEPAFSAHVEASGNMIKNVKSVIVPNTDGMKGIEAACIAGMVAGDAGKKLQVISRVTDQQKREIKRLSENPGFCTVSLSPSDIPLYLAVTLTSAHHTACVVIAQSHLNIIQEVLDGNILKQVQPEPADSTTGGNALDFMSVEGIYEYAQTVNPEEVRDLIETQLAYNLAIAEEGLAHDWGANIGKVLLKQDPHNVRQRAKAYAAAGSDARMSGCELPVVINSGSGNQGITVSMPIYIYAREWNVPETKLYRALVLANLLGIYQKKNIGRLSAYCGAISAGCAAAAGIGYMDGGDLDAVSHILVNGLAIASGVICDGAKPSCAGKIAIAVEAGLLAWEMYRERQQFYGGDGIVQKGVESTIVNIGRLGRQGMRHTDIEILNMMIGK